MWQLWVGLALLATLAAATTLFTSLLERRKEQREQRVVEEPVAGSERWEGKRVVVVVNPIGGAGHGKRLFQRIVKPMLAKAGVTVDLIETEYRGHAQRILTALDLSKYSAVFSISGDGMVHEMANGLWERYGSFDNVPPLVTIPGGTGNGLCTSLGAKDAVSAMQMFLRGEPRGLDMMMVTSLDESNRQALPDSQKLAVMSVHWGLTADFDTLTEESFRKIGNMRFLVTNIIVPWLLIYRAKSYKGRLSFVPLRNEQTDYRGNMNRCYDGKNHDKEQKLIDVGKPSSSDDGDQWVVIEDYFFTVVAATVPYLAHDACFAPKAELTDGHVDLFIVRGKNRGVLDEIRAFLNMENGKLLNLPFVEYFKTKKIFLEPLDYNDCGNYSIDGELVKAHPIEIDVQPSMGRFVY